MPARAKNPKKLLKIKNKAYSIVRLWLWSPRFGDGRGRQMQPGRPSYLPKRENRLALGLPLMDDFPDIYYNWR
jgi:hypothetical protein